MNHRRVKIMFLWKPSELIRKSGFIHLPIWDFFRSPGGFLNGCRAFAYNIDCSQQIRSFVKSEIFQLFLKVWYWFLTPLSNSWQRDKTVFLLKCSHFAIYFSSLEGWYTTFQFRSFSIWIRGVEKKFPWWILFGQWPQSFSLIKHGNNLTRTWLWNFR